MTKKEAQRRHARRRARERYGIEMGRATHAEIVAKIRGGRSEMVQRQSLRVAIHDVTLADGTVIRCVWDRKRGEVASVLERDWTGR